MAERVDGAEFSARAFARRAWLFHFSCSPRRCSFSHPRLLVKTTGRLLSHGARAGRAEVKRLSPKLFALLDETLSHLRAIAFLDRAFALER